jgi:hypothetical protein
MIEDLLRTLAFFAIWWALQRFVFPRAGVPT